MSMLYLRLPDSIRRRVHEMALREGVSVSQFITSVVVEKASALLTEELREPRARQLWDETLERILDQALEENEC